MNKIVVVLFLCTGCIVLTESAPSPPSTPNSALLYLSQYGYLQPVSNQSSRMLDGDALRKAVGEFQSFAGIEVTGELDVKTRQFMEYPRCGVKDKVGTSADRAKRYALQGSRWTVRTIRYRISKYPERLKPSEVDKELQRAFNVWSEHTDLSFKPVKTGKVHIEIRFEIGEHGDGDPFDGRGGTLAHAYFPAYGGDAHFDDAEEWTINSYRGTNLFQVASHEFGHSLGLSHSDERNSLMAPFYRGYDPTFRLHQDDIKGIQILYGKKRTKPANEEPEFPTDNNVDETSHGSPADDLCTDPSFDLIFSDREYNIFVFKGDKYYSLGADGIDPGYPKLINDRWKELPSNLDAAFTFNNQKTYFFKGSKYWKYEGTKLVGHDYPQEISRGFPGIPDDIDASFVWGGNNKLYFFKGSKFWRFDPKLRPPVDKKMPKQISLWKNVPNKVTSAFTNKNGFTYFFKDEVYYRFDDARFEVDNENPPSFPRSTAFWWFGCKEAPQGTVPREFGWLIDAGSANKTRNDREGKTFNNNSNNNSNNHNNSRWKGSNKNSGERHVVPISLILVTLITKLLHFIFIY